MRSAPSMAIAVLLASVASVAIVAPASAGPIETAKSAVAASDYFAARTAVAEALAAGNNSPEDMGEIYRLSGIVSGALGDPNASTEAFERCLALAPKAALAMGTSPKITRPFAAAQAFWKQSPPFKVRADTEANPPSVTVIVESDPLGMVARVRAAVSVDGKPEQTFDRAASERTTIVLPVGARLDVRVTALDARNNRLAEVGTKDVPIVIVGKPPAPVAPAPVVVVTRPRPPAQPRSRVLAWQLWAGVAIAIGGAATYFGIDAVRTTHELDDLNADSPNHDFDEAKRTESDARRSVLLANVGYGVAGGVAIGAAILFLTRPRTTETRISIAPSGRDGAAVVLGGAF